MYFTSLSIAGCYHVQGDLFQDNRGLFLKTFNKKVFQENGLEIDLNEGYFSVSHKNVIRGMHFQLPPYDHAKIVTVSSGSITDVLLDLRKDSITYGKYETLSLDVKKGNFVYIAKGIAHGFYSHEDNTIVNYLQTSAYHAKSDVGILYNSFGYDWEIENPIISERDLSFMPLEDFETPFI